MSDHDDRSAPVPTWCLVAGGGTAGHLHPGLAVAEELVALGCPRDAIHFVGSERGIEKTLVPEAGFGLSLLPGRGIQRRLTLQNVGAVIGLVRAMVRSVALVRRHRPGVVLSLGGYASVPCAIAALLWRVPVVVAEQNAVPGAANRLVAHRASACAVSFPGTALRRAVVTGNPVREEVLEVRRDDVAARAEARRELGVAPGRRLVLAFGGSLGARRINRAVADAVETLADRSDLAVRHVVGRRDWEEFRHLRERRFEALDYTAVDYEHHMPRALLAADLVICRSGASSVAELAAVGVPSVLVPLPGAPGDHQTANAAALVGAGAAVMVPDVELDGARLVAELDALMSDPLRLSMMAAAAAAVAHRDAAARVGSLLVDKATRPMGARQ